MHAPALVLAQALLEPVAVAQTQQPPRRQCRPAPRAGPVRVPVHVLDHQGTTVAAATATATDTAAGRGGPQLQHRRRRLGAAAAADTAAPLLLFGQSRRLSCLHG